LPFLLGKLIGWSRVGARVGTQFALFSVRILFFSPVLRYGNGTANFVDTDTLLVKLHFLVLVVRKGIWTYLFPSTAEVQKGIIPL
jgi:hypothetical protein